MTSTTVDPLVGRELLLDVACRLFMQDGYDGVSMQQIATAANMTKGSPYYHFKGKEDLFLHAFAGLVRQINAELIASLAEGDTLRERLVNGMAHMLATTNPGVIRMLDDFKRVITPECRATLPGVDHIPDVMRVAYEDIFATVAPGLRTSPAQAARALIAFQFGMLHTLITERDAQPLAEARTIAIDTIDLFLNGVLAPTPG